MNQHQNNENKVVADQLAGRVSRPHRTIVNGMRSAPTRRPWFASSPHIELADDTKSLKSAIMRTQAALFNLQRPEGFWLGELEANSTLYSDYVAFMHWSGEVDPDLQKKCVKHLLRKQLADGGWSIYQVGPARLDPSVKAYFALKLGGMESGGPRMRQAATLIRNLGGIEKVRYYTRFYLALLGQISWNYIPAIPVELVLAPRWSLINLYSVSAWTRAMLVPLSIVHHFKPTRNIPLKRGISELFITPDRKMASSRDEWFSGGITLLKWLQRCGILPSREAALTAAEQWILDRTGEGCSSIGAIFPSMLQTLIALRCLQHNSHGPTYRKAEAAFRNLFLDDLGGFRIQPCLSPVWDTAISILSLTESGIESRDSRLQKAAKWLAAQRVTIKGDWAVHIPDVEPSGWSFEFKNPFYPDVDDTAMVMLALNAANLSHRSIMWRSLEWLMGFQCRDGGWAAFDKNVQNPLLRYLPFADHKAILDPSCPDITGRVLEVFGIFRMGIYHPRVRRAIRFLRASICRGVTYLLNRQKPDGSWDENLPTGTGFPGVLYLRYDYYRKYWPLRALAIYASCLKRLKS